MSTDRPQAMRPSLTIRVSRDSGRTWSHTSVVHAVHPLPVMADPMRFPPCRCPRCTRTKPPAAATAGGYEGDGERSTR